jgi:hypothetical protein
MEFTLYVTAIRSCGCSANKSEPHSAGVIRISTGQPRQRFENSVFGLYYSQGKVPSMWLKSVIALLFGYPTKKSEQVFECKVNRSFGYFLKSRLIFTGCNSEFFLETFRKVGLLIKAHPIADLGKLIHSQTNQFSRFLQTNFIDKLVG